MVLLALISLTMLSLSTIESRSASQGNAMKQARANAHMALMIALGELQKTAGPDQRVSANSGILTDAGQSHLLGVWKSIGDGLAQPKDHAALANAYSASYTNDGKRNERFLGWLVSGDLKRTTDIGFPTIPSDNSYATLVGNGSLGLNPNSTPNSAQEKMIIRTPLVEINSDPSSASSARGAFAWAVISENLKARINLVIPDHDDTSTRIARRGATPTNSPSSLKPGASTSDSPDVSQKFVNTDNKPASTLDKALTQNNLRLAGSQVVTSSELGHYFHDLSTTANGLLTNTKWGGLRKDLSLLSEQKQLPAHMALSGVDSAHIFSEGPYWEDLTRYLNSYKSFSDGGLVEWDNNQPYYTLGPSWSKTVERRGWQQRMPVISKWLWLVSYFGEPINATQSNLNMVVQPVIELWNPFNLPLDVAPDCSYQLRFWSFPMALNAWTRSEQTTSIIKNRPIHLPVQDNEAITTGGGPGAVSYNIKFTERNGSPMRMNPGEVMLFSDGSSSPRLPSSKTIPLHKGLEIRGGTYSANVGDAGKKITLAKDEIIDVFYTRHNSVFYSDNYLQGHESSSSEFAYQSDLYTDRSAASTSGTFLPGRSIFSLAETSKTEPQPSLIIGAVLRTEHNLPSPAQKSELSTSEQTRFSPHLFSGLTLGQNYIHSNDQQQLETSPYVFFARRLTDYDDVHVALENNNGHLGRSHNAEGQTHIPVREIPIQPLTSMAQLQHAGLGHYAIKHDFDPVNISDTSDTIDTGKLKPWHLRSHPLVNLAFGNSFATPFIPQNSIETTGTSPIGAWSFSRSGEVDGWSFSQPKSDWLYQPGKATYQGLLHDKSWKLNEALWDGWFLSGIGDWTNPLITESRNLPQTVDGFTASTSDLPNPNYRPLAVNSAVAATEIKSADGYKKVARYILNRNSFNVNSTSIHAWKTVLGSLDLKAHSLSFLDASSGSMVDDRSDSGYAVSRFTLPNGESADAKGSGNDFWQKRWLGARKITDAELDKLASEMVAQVKQRGPFLSLSEFINRRLDSGEMGLHGALQEAINQSGINEGFENDSQSISPSDLKADYENPEALNKGHTGKGAPGYITQADLLMPVAPSLTVRCDTFTIRSYGESRDSKGKVTARAWCEATVQRFPDYVDSSNTADTELYDSNGAKIPDALTPTNLKFGRKFKVLTFRWLNPKEI